MSTTLDLAWVRNSFVEAITNSTKAEDLYKKLNETNCNNQPILLAYKGATEGLLAKHSFFPPTKLSYLNKSLQNINSSIVLSPQNEEIRHIRFNIETSIPSFLGHSVHLQEDKSFLLHFLQTTKINKGNSNLLKQYATTLLNSKLCKSNEINLLMKIVEQCKQA
jgi:hypothetical protein